MTCPVCHEPLPAQTPGRGRPRIYCSRECRSQAYKAAKPPPPPRPPKRSKHPSDDEILDWWQDYANGIPISAIALNYGRSRALILSEFIELGIPIGDQDFTGSEIKTMNALADVDYWHRHVQYARSMQHTKPIARTRVPQSQRQRAQDRMATGVWRAAVRKDLRRAGLLPR